MPRRPTDQASLPGLERPCCPHPLARHLKHIHSEAVPGDTWEVDICMDCGCMINERNRRKTGGGD